MSPTGRGIGAVIVTYDSDPIVEAVVEALVGGTVRPEVTVIVDNASTETAPLDRLGAGDHPGLRIDRAVENLGFCAGNNRGIRALADLPYVLLLNPDAIVTERFLEQAVDLLESDDRIGAVGPKLLNVDRATLRPNGKVDSAGIFLTAYGRPYDRGQGELDRGQYDDGVVDVPALCAAAMLCRRSALAAVSPGGQVFDESFFMYKEDVDLSLRLSAAGWRVVLDTGAVVHHRRGNDQTDRASTPAWVRKRSLANEWRIWRKGTLPTKIRIPMFGYLVAKSIVVRLGF